MSRTITATEANRRFSEILRDVSEGESYTVTSHGRPVAELVPVEQVSQRQRFDRLLAYLKTLPVRYSGPWKREDLYD